MKNRFVIAILLVLFVFFIDGISGGALRALTREAATQVWRGGATATEAIFGSGFFSTRRALERENKTLREELSQLQLRAVAFDAIREENDSLRTLVRLAEEERGITAPIVSSFRSSPYGTFLIGAGAEDGVAEGSLVLVGEAPGGFVIGRVESMGTRTSLVKALFAPGEETDAVIGGTGVIAKGRGGGQAQAEAPREAPIEVGDIVVALQFGTRPIGVVGSIEKEVGEASERVYLYVPVNVYEIRYVYVLPTEQ